MTQNPVTSAGRTSASLCAARQAGNGNGNAHALGAVEMKASDLLLAL
jgi:hypothetical protein